MIPENMAQDIEKQIAEQQAMESQASQLRQNMAVTLFACVDIIMQRVVGEETVQVTLDEEATRNLLGNISLVISGLGYQITETPEDNGDITLSLKPSVVIQESVEVVGE